jgi:hypothetical protein
MACCHNKRSNRRACVLAIVLSVIGLLPCYCRTVTATLSRNVVGASGAKAPEVSIVVTSIDTGANSGPRATWMATIP